MVTFAPPDPRRPAMSVDRAAVMAALADVPDPEIPAVSIVELGMVGDVEVGDRGIRVELLPTFVGCPALEVIRDAVERRLVALGVPVEIAVSFATPWTSERISREGRDKLRASGFAPPPHTRDGRSLPVIDAPAAAVRERGGADSVGTASDAVACPYCGSTRTTLENVFGPTQCRSIRHCAACRQPFEAFKAI